MTPPKPPEAFATKLKAELARVRMTQAQAAEFIGVAPRTLWKWLSGDEPATAMQAGSLAILRAVRPLKRDRKMSKPYAPRKRENNIRAGY